MSLDLYYKQVEKDKAKDALHQERARELLAEAFLPPRFTKDTLKACSAHEGWLLALNRAYAILRTRDSGRLVILCGPQGTGKTQMATQLVKCVIQNDLFFAAYSTLDEYFAAIQRKDPDWTYIDNRWINPRLVVFDEIGKAPDAGWAESKLFAIINRRFNDNKHSVLCTAAGPDELKNVLSPSVADRTNEGGAIIHLNWPSFRQ